MKKLLIVGTLLLFTVTTVNARFKELAQKMLPTAVTISVGGSSIGSGVLIENGEVLTAAHLFRDGEREAVVWLYPGNLDLRADVITLNVEHDLALLKPRVNLANALPYAKIAKHISVGEDVMCIGSPLSYDWSVTAGIVSHADRRNTRVTGILQSDTSINPGNSGGPLFNVDGELVGIASMITTDLGLFSGISLFVNLQTIKEFLNDARKLK